MLLTKHDLTSLYRTLRLSILPSEQTEGMKGFERKEDYMMLEQLCLYIRTSKAPSTHVCMKASQFVYRQSEVFRYRS